MKRLTVCLILEGSYPYTVGGVSAWVHELIQGIPEVAFALFTISPAADQPVRYTLPPNVTEHRDLVLGSPPVAKSPGTRKSNLVQTVQTSHGPAFAGQAMPMEALIAAVPEGKSWRPASLQHDEFWQILVDRNAIRNPLEPFSDYLWSWKASHDMLFRVLEFSPPEADLYHTVSTGFAGLAALAAKIRRKKPLFLTEHGLYHKEREMELRKTPFFRGYQKDHWIGLYRQLSQACYQGADLVTALFESNRLEQIRLGTPPERCLVVPNGIDTEKYESVVREPRTGFHVGLVGRVVAIKDIKTFIATAKVLATRWPDARFHCIGPLEEEPEYAKECKDLVVSLGLEQVFEFTGRQDVLIAYGYLDVMLLTSLREAQPLVICEAFAAGVPVVATRVGNIPEMLDYDERFLADPKDAQALADRVSWIRENPAIVRFELERQRQKTRVFYNRSTMLATFRDLYRRWEAP